MSVSEIEYKRKTKALIKLYKEDITQINFNKRKIFSPFSINSVSIHYKRKHRYFKNKNSICNDPTSLIFPKL